MIRNLYFSTVFQLFNVILQKGNILHHFDILFWQHSGLVFIYVKLFTFWHILKHFTFYNQRMNEDETAT